MPRPLLTVCQAIAPLPAHLPKLKQLRKSAKQLSVTVEKLVERAEPEPDPSDHDDDDGDEDKRRWETQQADEQQAGLYTGRIRFGARQLGGPSFVDTVYKVMEEFLECRSLGFFKVRVTKDAMKKVNATLLASSEVRLVSQIGSKLRRLTGRQASREACIVGPVGDSTKEVTFQPLASSATVLPYNDDLAAIFESIVQGVTSGKRKQQACSYGVGLNDLQKREEIGLPARPFVHCGERLQKTAINDVPGIHTAYAYLSEVGGSATPMHVEDGLLGSANVVLAGYPKLWLLVSPQHRTAFEQRVAADAGLRDSAATHPECSQAVRHCSLLLSPTLLERWGIPFSIVCCRAGELIATLPGTYHQVVNVGPNYAEAVNFADSEEWTGPPEDYRFCAVDSCPGVTGVALTMSHLSIEQDHDTEMSDEQADPDPTPGGTDGGQGEASAAQAGTGDGQGDSTRSHGGDGAGQGDQRPTQDGSGANTSREPSDSSDVFTMAHSLLSKEHPELRTVVRLPKRPPGSPSSSDAHEDEPEKRPRLDVEDDDEEVSSDDGGDESTAASRALVSNMDQGALVQRFAAGGNVDTAAVSAALDRARLSHLPWAKTRLALRFMLEAAHPQQLAMFRNVILSQGPTTQVQAMTEGAISATTMARDQVVLNKLAEGAEKAAVDKVRAMWEGARYKIYYHIGFKQLVEQVRDLLKTCQTQQRNVKKRADRQQQQPRTDLEHPTETEKQKQAKAVLQAEWGISGGTNEHREKASTIVENRIAQLRVSALAATPAADAMTIDEAREESSRTRTEGQAILELLPIDAVQGRFSDLHLLLLPLYGIPLGADDGLVALSSRCLTMARHVSLPPLVRRLLANRRTTTSVHKESKSLRRFIREQLPRVRPELAELMVRPDRFSDSLATQLRLAVVSREDVLNISPGKVLQLLQPVDDLLERAQDSRRMIGAA